MLGPALRLARRHRFVGLVAGLGGAAILHALGGSLVASIIHAPPRAAPAPTTEIEIEAPPPAPPPPPPPEPAEPEAKAVAEQPAPAPAAAQAGKVLTAAPDPAAPVDMTGEGFVNGNGDSFAGGQTAADGTSKTAVGSIASKAVERPRVVPKPPPPPAPDLSKPAMPMSLAWNCGFPPEDDDVDHARVTIVVSVGADGRPTGVRVTSDPGNGFGRVARSCAMGMRYNAGRDRAGSPTSATTPPFVVRFDR